MEDDARIPVVLRYRDGHTERCTLTREFSPRQEVVDVLNADGEAVRVDVDDLKAVFFVKDPRRRDVEMTLGAAAEDEPGSALARVEFFDGEIIRGRVFGYSVANKGFFLYPTAVESNNWRIFVVASALTTVAIDG